MREIALEEHYQRLRNDGEHGARTAPAKSYDADLMSILFSAAFRAVNLSLRRDLRELSISGGLAGKPFLLGAKGK